jgi:hypothetical protein
MHDLIACPACDRNNGARRTTCLYCGATLPVTEETADLQVPTFRPVEDWERGHSVVLAPLEGDEPTNHQIERLAEIGKMETETASAVFASRTPLPIARVGTPDEAGLVGRLLGSAGLETAVVPDEALALERQVRRLRELRLGANELEAHVLWGAWESLSRDEVALIVSGRAVTKTVEIVEGAGRKKKTDAGDASMTFSETWLVDVYGPSLDRSFRVKADSFDFSCLGRRPAPRLEENVAALVELLADYVGRSRTDASFGSVAKLLEHAWPSAASVRSIGLTMRGDLRRYTRSQVTTDAVAQFTRYSRMRYVLSRAARSVS